MLQMNNLYCTKNVSKVILMIFLIGISMLGSSDALKQQKSSIKTIVIDAGHGGKDPGCIGSHSQEKEVSLSIALALGKILEDSLGDVDVVYTRKTDRYVDLKRRASIANTAQADLFISIHCNAHTNTGIKGFETYVMGLDKSNANLNLVKRENGDIELPGAREDLHANDPEAHIILSMQQNTFQERSISFASLVQHHQTKNGTKINLGVKQANFAVLWQTTMPSVLIESGFLTNQQNEDYLTSEIGEKETAYNIFEAVKAYKEQLEQANN